MPNNKKHHYVPKFYLRRFSPSESSICLWNIKKQKLINTANLKNQCYKDYFYGKDLKLEKILCQIEGATATILKKIDELQMPPPRSTPDLYDLILFILSQHFRTTRKADATEETFDFLIKRTYRHTAEEMNIDLDKFRIAMNDPAQFILSLAFQYFPLLIDLEAKLIINKTKIEFITSDNPVVMCNPLLSFRKIFSNTGLATKGLMIFFPISPGSTLILYDKTSYQLGNPNISTIETTLERDINEINAIQYCSAKENIYLNCADFNIHLLHKKASPLRPQKTNKFNIMKINEDREFITTSNVDIDTNLSLSFLRTRTSTKKWLNNLKRQSFQPAIILRNPELHDTHDKKIDALVKSDISQDQYSEYVCDLINEEIRKALGSI